MTDVFRICSEEQRQREDGILFRALAETMPHLVWSTTPDGMHDYYNQRWYDYTGKTYEETKGEGWATLLHPDDVERSWKIWKNALKTGDSYQIEYRFRRGSDGSYRWFLGRALPVRNEQGIITRWFGTCTDIEDQKQAEEELVHLNHRLQEARDHTLTASHAKSAFLANMSHEFRTPLNVIVGYSEYLDDALRDEGIDPDELLKCLGRIRDSASHLQALVNDVLDLAKIEAGHIQVDSHLVDVTKLLCDIKSTVVQLAEERGNRIDLQFNSEVQMNPQIRNDEVKLRQVLLNLAGNACKFTRDGEITLRASRRHNDEQEWLVLEVIDTGIGITPEDQKRLFQDFVQLEASPTRRFSGTGLGLAISKRYVEVMGGRIEVESEEGHGSTFRLWFPAG